MNYKSFLLAVAALGATVGVLHAITQSPASGSVLQILGALIAACFGIFLGSDAILKDRQSLKETLPILSKTTLALLAAYWIGFGTTKYAMPNWIFALGSEFDHLSEKDKADAYRLLALNESLGVPRNTTEQRILQILPETDPGKRCTKLSETEEIQVLHLASDPNLTCAASLGKDIRQEASELLGQKKIEDYQDRLSRLRLTVRLLPKDYSLAMLHKQLEAGNCKAPQGLGGKIDALMAQYSDCVPDLEYEIRRVLQSAPEVNSAEFTKLRMVPESGKK